MRTMVLEVSVPRIVLTRLLGGIWNGAYFAPTSPKASAAVGGSARTVTSST